MELQEGQLKVLEVKQPWFPDAFMIAKETHKKSSFFLLEAQLVWQKNHADLWSKLSDQYVIFQLLKRKTNHIDYATSQDQSDEQSQGCQNRQGQNRHSCDL